MEVFKVENYEREHGQGTFPAYRRLGSQSSQEVRRQLAGALGIAPTSSGTEVVRAVWDRSQPVEGADAENEDFDLCLVLDRLGLACTDKLYLNWHHYEDVDEMCAADVTAHFTDIWYPSSDDIDIFDQNMLWVVSITHYGAVRVTRLESG